MTEEERRANTRINGENPEGVQILRTQHLKWMRAFDPNTRQFVGRQGMLAMSQRKKLLSQVENKKGKDS